MNDILVANRGEIAIRIARAARSLGRRAVMVHSEDDATARHLAFGDGVEALSGRGPRAYLNVDAIIEAARRSGCAAVHPGYGFLSESAALAEACAKAGLVFIGPPADVLATLGDKARATALAAEQGVPTPRGLPGGVGLGQARAFLEGLGEGAGIMVKAVAGGGGRGVRLVRKADALESAFEACRREAAGAFGCADLYVEELIEHARHIEVQLLADRTGAVAHLYERECTLQRNRQKLIEIAPSPALDDRLRRELIAAACKLGEAVGLRGLATFEFLVRRSPGEAAPFVFIEANPRIQVEHTVTEEITGVDLVAAQIRLCEGALLGELGLSETPPVRGHALQVRISAERPESTGAFAPVAGRISRFEPPTGPGVRVDTSGHAGLVANPAYDPLLAKLIIHAEQGGFEALVARARAGLQEFVIEGCDTNRGFLLALLGRSAVASNDLDTEYVDRELAALVKEAERYAEASSSPDAQDAEAAPAPEPVVPEGLHAVRAPISGVLVSAGGEPGQIVPAGRAVGLLEAMKMEHEIPAPCTGVVEQVLVEAGRPVAEGDLVAFMRPAETQAPEEGDGGAFDPDHVRPDLEEVVSRHQELGDAARPDAVERRRKTGSRTARENVADLCDPGGFVEYGGLNLAAQRRRRSYEDLRASSPADGLVAGVGSVNGGLFADDVGQCAVLAYDYTVFAGTQGAYNHKKTDRLIDVAERSGLPLVVFAEGGGGRPGETDVRLGLDTPTFARFARLSGKAPIVSIVSGYCFAGNAALAGCADVIIATANSSLGMGGPAMIEGGGLGVYKPMEVGPVDTQVANGVVDIAVADEAEAVKVAKHYLSFFQGTLRACDAPDARELRHVVPENRMRVYAVRDVVSGLLDTGSFLELKAGYGRAMVTGLGRLAGRPVGVIANDPRHLSGAIDAEAATKAAGFLRLCETHRLPVVSLVDTPGFMVGPDVEARGQVRAACDLFIAGAKLTTPFLAVVLRKAYGLGAQAMVGGCFHSPQLAVSWPTGEFGAMGLEGAVRLGFRRELEAIADPAARDAFFKEKLDELHQEGKALTAAEFMEIDDVVDPAATRDLLVRALQSSTGRPGA